MHDVDKKGYNQCQMLTISHWYCYMPQGRPSGITDMRMYQYPELMTLGAATSTAFKTADKYSYQPVANVIAAIPFLTKTWKSARQCRSSSCGNVES